MSALKILVVEDNRITRRMLRVALESQGWSVVEAADGKSAIEAFTAARPDLLIQDLTLPDIDGLALLERLAALSGGTMVPVIATSGFLSKLEEARNLSIGFVERLFKPVDPHRLIEIVRGLEGLTSLRESAGRGRSVLLVDDDPIQARLLKVQIEHAGFNVTTAFGAEEALEAAHARVPDAIVSDVLMPGIDGFRFCMMVRKSADLGKVPVVLVSAGFTEEADQALARQAGAHCLVERTPDHAAVIEALLRALGAGPAAPLAEDAELSTREFTHRMIRELEHQVGHNAELAGRLALHEAAMGVIGRLGDTTRRGSSLDELVLDLLQNALDAAGISIGAVFLREGERYRLAAQHGFRTGNGALGSFYGRSDVLDRAARAAHATNVPERDEPDAPERELLEAIGARSLLLVPLELGGERLGVLVLAAARRRFSTDWLPFAGAIAVQISHAVALARAVAQLGEEREKLRQVTENIEEILFLISTDQRTVYYVSPAYETIFGRSRESFVTNPLAWQEAIHPGDRERVARESLEGQRRGVVTDITFRIVRPDGSLRWVRGRSFPVRDAAGVVVRYVGTVMDVTDLKQAQEELNLLHSLTLAVSTAETPIAALTAVLDGICKATSWVVGQAWVPSRDGTVLECSSVVGDPEEFGGFRKATMGLRTARGEGLVGRAWATKEIVKLADISVEDSARAGLALAAGLHSVIVVPVVAGEEVAAVLMFLTRERVEPDPRVTKLVAALGSQLGAAIQRRLAEEALDKTEEQLRRAQKMEAIGRLAGGIAHDFNNLLTAVLGFSELALGKLDSRDPLRRDLEQIRKAGERAAGLTRQLLIFSRHETIVPQVLDPNTVLVELERMLRRVIGEDVTLQMSLGRDLGRVKVDKGYLEQVAMNLCVNARDAMPRGGRIVIETAGVELEEGAPGFRGPVKGGRYIMIAVTDTGGGMSQDVLSHLFEPFFTTKEAGKGTGLGLSTVYGIVQGAGGNLAVYSEVGHGSTFKVYLPRVEEAVTLGTGRAPTKTTHGTETILLVEDEAMVRSLAAGVLAMQGYDVIATENGAEALLELEKRKGKIHLLMSDVIMPGMSGPELVERAHALCPGLKVLFTSGYTSGALLPSASIAAGQAFLQKPFTPGALARKVREVLDANP
jgi:PAS domain S-box-containing protein